MIVLTDSMYPVIKSGDLIILNKIDAKDVKVGDIITYFDPTGKTTTTVTHRVIELTTIDKELAFRTKGDANNTDDKTIVPNDKLVGIYKTRIAQLGNVAMFMSTTKGLIICVVVPLILIIGYDLFRRRKIDKKNNEDKAILLAELEKLKAPVDKKEVQEIPKAEENIQITSTTQSENQGIQIQNTPQVVNTVQQQPQVQVPIQEPQQTTTLAQGTTQVAQQQIQQ